MCTRFFYLHVMKHIIWTTICIQEKTHVLVVQTKAEGFRYDIVCLIGNFKPVFAE